jgi:hypothetical protein
VIVPENVGYVLQVRDEERDGVWMDMAMVLVAPRTKRLTVYRKAVAEAGIEVPEEGLDARLLDAETAEPIRLLPRPPEPGPKELQL